jgi:uncharacterized protein (DUF1810 family)
MSQLPLPSDEQDPFDLARFLEAQAGVYDRAAEELRSGQKQSHWMWYIFPQFQGLGRRETAAYFAIRSLPEARAYLQHPVLGARLLECTRIVNGLRGRSAREIFDGKDDVDEKKFRSSMTLFELASGSQSEFTFALEKYFGGERDAMTLHLVSSITPDKTRTQPGPDLDARTVPCDPYQ